MQYCFPCCRKTTNSITKELEHVVVVDQKMDQTTDIKKEESNNIPKIKQELEILFSAPTIMIPSTVMGCHCLELLNLDENVINLNLVTKLPGNKFQHVHHAQMFTIFNTYQVVIKTTDKKNEFDILRYLETCKFENDENPFVKLLASHEFRISGHMPIYHMLVMQHVGDDLHNYIKKNIRTSDENIHIVRSLVTQFAKLHDNDVAHLDPSLENVIYNPFTKICLLIDFEFSKILDPLQQFHFNKNQNLVRFGKLYCMSQEQHAQKPSNGFQIDVFGIGVMCFVIFMFFQPFKSHWESDGLLFHDGHIRELVEDIRGQTMEDISKLDNCDDLVSFIQLCCSRPNVRPRHARDLLYHPFLINIQH